MKVGTRVTTWHGDTGVVVDPSEYTGPNANHFKKQQDRIFVCMDHDVYDHDGLDSPAGAIVAISENGLTASVTGPNPLSLPTLADARRALGTVHDILHAMALHPSPPEKLAEIQHLARCLNGFIATLSRN